MGAGVGDRVAIVTCLNDDDSVFRVTGCAAFGAHENSYRLCGDQGQVENICGTDNILLRFNEWNIPEGGVRHTVYSPEWNDKDSKLIDTAGHGGGDFLVIREFFRCINENERPVFDEYFATTMASVGILGHKSAIEKGVPYDIPDLHLEENRLKYENDTLSPFYGTDGSDPTIAACSHPEYKPSPEDIDRYDQMLNATE